MLSAGEMPRGRCGDRFAATTIAPLAPDRMSLLAFALAALVGISLGLLGGGGSILTVPILVYVVHVPPREAIAMSLAVVGTVSLVGAAGHWRQHNVIPRVALLFGAIAMAGSYLGSRLAALLDPALQLFLFALVMLAAAVMMLRPRPATPRSRLPHVGAVVPVALGVGILTGLIGVGGGFLIVPALVLLTGIEMKKAVGTSLLVIAMNCAAGLVGYLGHVRLDVGILASFIGAALAGTVIGTRLVRFISQDALKRFFGVFLIVMAAFILYRSREVVLRHLTQSPSAPAER